MAVEEVRALMKKWVGRAAKGRSEEGGRWEEEEGAEMRNAGNLPL